MPTPQTTPTTLLDTSNSNVHCISVIITKIHHFDSPSHISLTNSAKSTTHSLTHLTSHPTPTNLPYTSQNGPFFLRPPNQPQSITKPASQPVQNQPTAPARLVSQGYHHHHLTPPVHNHALFTATTFFSPPTTKKTKPKHGLIRRQASHRGQALRAGQDGAEARGRSTRRR